MERENEGNSTDEIKSTEVEIETVAPAVIEAGVTAFYNSDRRFDTIEEIVKRIYIAMSKATLIHPNTSPIEVS